jgi:beta-mannosidase
VRFITSNIEINSNKFYLTFRGIENTKSMIQINSSSDESGELKIHFNITVKKSDINLWWPNGAGNQTLYNLKVKWEDSKLNDVDRHQRKFLKDSKTIKIGFRTIELVQESMSNGLSFYFKVNGVSIFMKGSNWIPSHILPEKLSQKQKVGELLRAARDANMNMLRVWGGGVYESDLFYSLADEYGILIWQDMMFACAMYPADENFLDSVREEIKQQTRRLQKHPSIALFATNNENEAALRQDWYGTQSKFNNFAKDYNKLYVNTITDEILKQDSTREVLTSSPSNGKYNGDKTNGISIDPQNPHYGDIHFYIYDQNGWKPEHFHQPRFASEYGFQSFPSGWNDVIRKNYDNLTTLIEHRQHHPLRSKPIKFLIEDNLDLKVNYDQLEWDDKIYLSQLSQAMAMKTETEMYRSGRASFMNTMGALYWQLNDVWVAPSWSSIEYNGNYKVSY